MFLNLLLVNLLWTATVWKQSAACLESNPKTPQISQQKRHRSASQLPQLKQYSTSAADLVPVGNSNLLETDHTYTQAQTEPSEGKGEESDILQPTKDRLRINFGEEESPFTFGFGSRIGEPTALQGITRRKVVSTSAQIVSIFPVGGFFQQRLETNQKLLLEALGDPQAVGFDLSYTIAPETLPGTFSVNAMTQRSFAGVFEEGDDVNLPGGADPWVHRSGGGVEYLMPISSQFSLAGALNYQLISVRPGAFTNQVESRDEEGNRVTVSNDGQDTLLTFNLASFITTVDDLSFPTSGSKLRFGIDTSLPVGNASIAFGRFSGNFSQFIPVHLFSLSEGPETLIFNLQAGTIIGDVPPYEAFSMGGSSSIRGYRGGEVGSGSSFFLASAEYRFPIANDLRILVDFDLQGTLFFDYGTDLDTADEVIGEPAIVRDKGGDGFGYGLGLHARTGFGLVRAEFALNDNGDFTTHFTVGDRY